MQQFYYTEKKQIGQTKSGRPNYYYDQISEQREAVAKHIQICIGFLSERGEGFEHSEKDWKLYNQELGKEVKWASGRYTHNPSVRCLWAQLQMQMPRLYAGKKARFSVIQIDQFNRSIQVAAKLYNTYTTNVHKITADHYKIEMVQLAQHESNINKFDEFFAN